MLGKTKGKLLNAAGLRDVTIHEAGFRDPWFVFGAVPA